MVNLFWQERKRRDLFRQVGCWHWGRALSGGQDLSRDVFDIGPRVSWARAGAGFGAVVPYQMMPGIAELFVVDLLCGIPGGAEHDVIDGHPECQKTCSSRSAFLSCRCSGCRCAGRRSRKPCFIAGTAKLPPPWPTSKMTPRFGPSDHARIDLSVRGQFVVSRSSSGCKCRRGVTRKGFMRVVV